MNAIAAAAAAKLNFDAADFLSVAGLMLGAMLVVRFFTPDRLLPHPRTKQLLAAVPFVAGAVWGFAFWRGSSGAFSGMVWGGWCGLAAHALWWLIAVAVKLVRARGEEVITGYLGRKFGISLGTTKSVVASDDQAVKP